MAQDARRLRSAGAPGSPEGSRWPNLLHPPAPGEQDPGPPSLCAPQIRLVPAAMPAPECPPDTERGAPGAPSEP